MVVSHGREYDRAVRKSILEIIQICILQGKMEEAKKFGFESARLKKKIETFDYSKQDKEEMELYTNTKKWEKIMRTGSV